MERVVTCATLLALATLMAWGGRWLWRVLAIGAAYKAKILATAIFGMGQRIDPQRAPEVSADAYWMLRFFRASIDVEARTVTVSCLGLRPRLAIDRPGLGATVAQGDRLSHPTVPLSDERPQRLPVPWVTADSPRRLRTVVDGAFAEPTTARLRRTRAVLVVHDGRIIAEQYADGFDQSRSFPGWSMTKSVLAALVGVLVGEGRLTLADREVLAAWRAPDPRAGITVEDLLRMRSGLAFREVYTDLSSDVIEMLFNCPDTVTYAASRPLVAPPGTAWGYASGTTNILSGVIRRVVGEDAYLQWPRRALFDPIGMDSAVMEVDSAGNFVCSSFMLATARDWARFGQLHLEDGVWAGRRILPAGWVGFCRTPTPQSVEGNYGAHWWLKLQPEMGGGTAAAARLPRDTFFALGHEGQTLTVIPSRRLVVVRLGLSIYVDAWNHAGFLADVLDAV